MNDGVWSMDVSECVNFSIVIKKLVTIFGLTWVTKYWQINVIPAPDTAFTL